MCVCVCDMERYASVFVEVDVFAAPALRPYPLFVCDVEVVNSSNLCDRGRAAMIYISVEKWSP